MFAAKNELLTPSSTGYRISRSLRFRSSASAYLSRTPASAGNRKTWTWSGWVKRGALGQTVIMSAYDGSSTTQGGLIFNTNDTAILYTGGSGSYGQITTTAVYRDTSAWYHIVAVCDTTQATSTSRMAIYVNGVNQAVTFNSTPSQNYDGQWNAVVTHTIGKYASGSTNFDGYLAEINLIDGQALTPSSFGAYDASTGVWGPKQYTGSYGTNGFYLAYSDPSGSGNGNDTYTKLLLHGNGLNDSAWNGSSNHALTAYGSATTSTTQTKFGMSSSLYTLGSSSQYFRTDASADFKYAAASGSTNDFTFDFWFYPGASGTAYPHIQVGDSTYSSLLVFNASFFASSNNTSWDISSGNTLGIPTTGQWNHYAIVRSGSTWYAFLNGVQQSTWTNSSAGYDYTTNNYIQIGRSQGGSTYSTGYYAEARWSAGIARWTSDFTPPTAPYSGGSGSDSSGNVNAWRPFNINTSSSGTTYDSMIDSPTNYADGGNGRGNYCTWNPVNKNATVATTDANLSANSGATASAHRMIFGSLGFTTPSYFEITTSGGTTSMVIIVGVGQNTTGTADGVYVGSYSKSFGLGYATNAASWYATGATNANGAATNLVDGTWGFAVDPANGKAWVRNTSGNWIGGGDPAAGTLPTFTWTSDGLPWFPIMSFYNVATTFVGILNAGQRSYAFTAPSGFVALNTQNLPTPTIANGAQYMAATTYTGNGTGSGSTQTISNGAFQPDFVWIKSRSTADYHNLVDSVRGISTSSPNLFTNATSAETVYANAGVTAVTSTGFTLTANGSYTNANGTSYIGWQWKAGGTGVSNTSGSITSTVSANTSAGFSVVTYTGTGTTGTVGHGLGVAPSMVITKKRSTSGDEWIIWHTSLSGGNFILLFTTAAQFASTQYTAVPSSTVLNLNTATAVNNNGSTYVSYVFAPVAGYSAIGSYTGNGSADGTFVYLGFRPRFVMIKSTTLVQPWNIFDTSRDPYNVEGQYLQPGNSGAEATFATLDVTSNGFKLRTSGAHANSSGDVLIYAAFAENPFKYSRAR